MPHLIGAAGCAGDSAVPAELIRNFTIASLASCRDLLDAAGRYRRVPVSTRRTLTESLRFGVNDPPQVEKIGAPIVCPS